MEHAVLPTPSRSFGLDVCRTLAIGGVLAAHGIAAASRDSSFVVPVWIDWAGVIGVELFFALSGFLIGGLLIEISDRQPTPRSWLVFMARRWMRTLPLYFVCLAFLLIFMPPADIWTKLMRYGTLTQNFTSALPQDMFFNVTWSLAVEEWFYLFASIGLLAGAAVWGRKGQWLVLAAFIVLPFIARLDLPASTAWDASIRKVVVLRLDAIAFGLAVALLRARGSILLRQWRPLLAFGIVANLYVYAAYTEVVTFDVFQKAASFSLMGLGSAATLPAFLRIPQNNGWIGRAVRHVSDLSYGLYLIHIIVLQFVTYHSWKLKGHPVLIVLAAGVITWCAAWTSRRYIEQWCLDHRPKQFRSRPSMVAWSSI